MDQAETPSHTTRHCNIPRRDVAARGYRRCYSGTGPLEGVGKHHASYEGRERAYGAIEIHVVSIAEQLLDTHGRDGRESWRRSSPACAATACE